MGDEPDRRSFLEHLIKICEEVGAPIINIPVISKVPLDLYKFYKIVQAKGGYVEVRRFSSCLFLLFFLFYLSDAKSEGVERSPHSVGNSDAEPQYSLHAEKAIYQVSPALRSPVRPWWRRCGIANCGVRGCCQITISKFRRKWGQQQEAIPK